MDDFLMSAVASDGENGEDFCRLVLSVLLGRKIGRVHVTAQRTIPALTPKLRGIRMDVEVVEETENGETETQSVCNIYDLEPHNLPDMDLPKHNRFYQARIDSRYLKQGEREFSRLPNLYVITITPYDPFGKDYMVYTIYNRCREVPDMPYSDGVKQIFFNTKGTKGGSPEIRAMLDYFQESSEENAVGEVLEKIHQYVSQVKLLPEVREELMHLEDYIWYYQKEAKKETMLENIRLLLEDYGELPAAVKERLEAEKDPAVLTKWLKVAAKADSLAAFESAIQE